jgi:hypothetical protein
MIDAALRARLPLISVATTDPTSAQRCLAALAGVPRDRVKDFSPGKQPERHILVDIGGAPVDDFKRLAAHLRDRESSLVVVNFGGAPPAMFYDAGQLPTRDSVIRDYLVEIQMEDREEEILPSLRGLTLAQCDHAIRLASAIYGDISPNGLQDVRSQLLGRHAGLERVSTAEEPAYVAPDELSDWIKAERRWFLNPEADARLRPRGILFYGPEGTGKTLGAGYIARSWDIPLFRLNVAGVKQRYVGETEKALGNMLAQVEQNAPCCLLIDEIEKLLGTQHSDEGITAGILAELLWWTERHRSRVLTVMTTNDRSTIPRELIRKGRVDRQICLVGVLPDKVAPFARYAISTFGLKPAKLKQAWGWFEERQAGLLPGEYAHQRDRRAVSQADVMALVREAIKTTT